MRNLKVVCSIGIAVLFALAMVSCDVFAPPETADAPAPEGLTINILGSGGNGRALTTPIGEAGADYYEVYFYDGTTEARTSFGNGKTGKINPADGLYDNTGAYKAYMFAGTSDGTLLGVGEILFVTNAGGVPATPAAQIDMSVAREVTFIITALNTDVKADPDSTFKTWTGAPPANAYNTIPIDNYVSPTIMAPVFNLAPSATAVPATFNITDTAGNALSASIRSAIIVAATPGGVTSKGYIPEAFDAPMARVTGTLGATVVPGSQLPIPIPLQITPGMKEGLSKMYIDVLVTMNGGSEVWHIRGGLNNSLLDLGAATNGGDGSTGGAILIGVGDYLKNTVGIIVNPGDWQ